jgi:hypothetical protein
LRKAVKTRTHAGAVEKPTQAQRRFQWQGQWPGGLSGAKKIMPLLHKCNGFDKNVAILEMTEGKYCRGV